MKKSCLSQRLSLHGSHEHESHQKKAISVCDKSDLYHVVPPDYVHCEVAPPTHPCCQSSLIYIMYWEIYDMLSLFVGIARGCWKKHKKRITLAAIVPILTLIVFIIGGIVIPLVIAYT